MHLTKQHNNEEIILNIDGNEKEIDDFECSLSNWGVCNKDTFNFLDEYHASVKVSEKKLLEYFENLEMGRFDPDRIFTERLKDYVDKRAQKRFSEIAEIERQKL